MLLFRGPNMKYIYGKTYDLIILNLNIINDVINVLVFTSIGKLRLI